MRLKHTIQLPMENLQFALEIHFVSSVSKIIYNITLFQVIRVDAKDEDCSPHFGDICGYEIESKGQPFTISKEGNISK